MSSPREQYLRHERQHRQRFLAELEPRERLLAYGKQRARGHVAVTPRRIISEWRLFISLPFDRVTRAQQEIFETHRYRLRLWHERIDLPPEPAPDPWDISLRARRFWRRRQQERRTVLEFSRPDTAAAEAIRQELARRSIPLAPPTVLPHRRARNGDPYLRSSPLHTWRLRRLLRKMERRAPTAG